MKEFTTAEIRNVAFAGHFNSGKTSIMEAMLTQTKVTDRLGSVDDGNSVSDSDPEEIRRKVSISASVIPCEYKGVKINHL